MFCILQLFYMLRYNASSCYKPVYEDLAFEDYNVGEAEVMQKPGSVF